MRKILSILLVLTMILSLTVCFAGCDTGVPGEKGDKGEQGIQGEKGENGADGKDGADGITPQIRINSESNEWEISYDNGENWISLGVKATGNDGADGKDGIDGADGKDGVEGEPGEKGDKGDQGEPGEKGDKGDQGEPGEKGDKGDQGEPGEKGDKGDQGEPGEKGDKGDQGEPGEKGDKGDQGEPGEKGDKGDQGEPGEKGDKGDQGEPGEKGDKGDQGEKGEKGDKGDQGEPGAGIQSIEFDEQGRLVITLTDGTKLPPVELPKDETKFSYIGTTADTYITESMENAADAASQYFSINKYRVVPGSKVRIQARMGELSYCAWVDTSGNRTEALQGPGGGSGWNTDRTLIVPGNAVYLEVSYVTQYGLSVREIGSNTRLIEYLGTTEKTYINNNMSNAAPDSATPTYCIDRYSVTPGCEVHIFARIGAAAYCAWVDAEGHRSKALQGNSNPGRNVNQTLIVPQDAVYLDVSYSTTQELYVGNPMTTEGLKIGLLGDSIAANGGFFNRINSVLGTTGKNVSVGGWFYSEDAGVDNEYPGDTSKGIYRQVENLSGNEDLVIIWAGTNDFGHSHPIGDMDDRNPDTFYGGMHTAITALHEKCGEDITIILCTPLHRNMEDGGSPGYPYSSDQTNKLGNSLQAYWNAIYAIADYYDLLVFDAHTETGLDPRTVENNTKYFNDGLHPNAAGHIIIGDKLAQYIKENLA